MLRRLGLQLLAMAGKVGAVPSAYLIDDAFADTNGVSLDAHTISPTNTPGTSWTERVGNWDIQSNRASAEGAATTREYSTVASGVSDCTLDVIVGFGSAAGATQEAGFISRFSDATHYWLLRLNIDSSPAVNIYENDGGFALRASTAATLAHSTDYDFQAIHAAQSITCTVDGGSQAQYNSASFNETATVHGIDSYATDVQTTVNRFDDFRITAG